MTKLKVSGFSVKENIVIPEEEWSPDCHVAAKGFKDWCRVVFVQKLGKMQMRVAMPDGTLIPLEMKSEVMQDTELSMVGVASIEVTLHGYVKLSDVTIEYENENKKQ